MSHHRLARGVASSLLLVSSLSFSTASGVSAQVACGYLQNAGTALVLSRIPATALGNPLDCGARSDDGSYVQETGNGFLYVYPDGSAQFEADSGEVLSAANGALLYQDQSGQTSYLIPPPVAPAPAAQQPADRAGQPAAPAAQPAAQDPNVGTEAPDSALVQRLITAYEVQFSTGTKIDFQGLQFRPPFVVTPQNPTWVNIDPGTTVYPVVASFTKTVPYGNAPIIHQITQLYYIYHRAQAGGNWYADGVSDQVNSDVSN